MCHIKCVYYPNKRAENQLFKYLSQEAGTKTAESNKVRTNKNNNMS